MDYMKCKFISDGTWFDKETEVKLDTYLAGTDTGIFTGIRNGDPDGELCTLDEFWIYDENNKLIREPKEE